MLDPAIQGFLNERKELWLKKKIKSQNTDEENVAFEQQANDLFNISTWLPDAAKRAKQLTIVSHPAKFSHPSAKASAIIAETNPQNDGFLRTGNVKVALDVFGNAAAMDVFKFLTIELRDGKSILSHLEENSATIQQQFSLKTASYGELSQDLLALKSRNSEKPKTSGNIKQIYFPINSERSEYHLLSILTPSNIMFELKSRIDAIRFSQDFKEARKARREGKSNDTPYSEIYNLTAVGFGGTKPQNISVLNSQNGGVSLLLESLPPQIEKRRINPPRNSFFNKRYLNPKYFQDEFNKIFTLILLEHNNKGIRNKIQWQCKAIFYQLIDRSWEIRRLPEGWSDTEHYENLSSAQKTWLDKQYSQKRNEDSEWLDIIKKEMVRWFMRAYNELLDNPKSNIAEADIYKIRDYEFVALMDWLNDCEVGLL